VRTVAALYVDTEHGPYASMSGVDAWGVERDATTYDGAGPVVAHPPCGHWGAFRWNCKQPQEWKSAGPVAVAQVRRLGGVLEHPASSMLWRHCRLPRPHGFPDAWGGFAVEVDQVWWGHQARKRSWVYVVGVPMGAVALTGADKSAKPTRVMGVSYAQGRTLLCLPKSARHITPPRFAAWLVGLARQVQVPA